MLKVATLFSGVGTPEQSLKHLQVEHETIFACEIDKYARTTYLANNKAPNTFYDDVYNIDGNKYKNQIDILIGGSPCQSFSIAGKRMGTSCPRGNLIYEYFRIVEESQPKVFIYENVKGFLSIDKGETFKNFVQSFKDLGYTTYHQVLNTKDYLVPQNRERIYIVGFKDNVDFHFQEKQELKLRLKDMLEDFVDEKYLLNQELVSKYLETGTASNHKGSQAGKVADETDETFWTVNAGTHGYSMGYVKLKQTHTLNIKGNDSIKRIYSSDGHNPSLTTMQGGHREPKIAHPVREVGRRLDENGKRCDDNKDIPITRRYEIGDKEISNCLSGVQKDSYVAITNGVIEIENDEVRVREAVAKGFTLATEGDSINISVPSSKTRRGRVGKQVAQTLDTACNQVVFNNQYIFRKLTERECFRLQGFNDNFIFPKETKSLYFQFVYDKINEKEIKWNVQSKVVKEKQKQLNTETYVFYTTKEWQDMEQLVKTKIETMQDLKEKMQDVNIVMKKSEEVVQKECATNTIKWTDCIKTLFLEITEKGYQEVEVILEEDTENQSIGQSWRIQLEENLTKEKLYITLILLKQIIISKTYMYVKVHQNTQKFMFSLKSLSRECLKMELSYLKMEYTKELISSSQLYKQAGNGMSRNILDMIFTQIFTCYSKHIENKEN